MPADVFGRNDVVFGGALAADATRVTFGGLDSGAGGGTGLILQQVRIQYNQQVTRLYGLEDGAIYYVAGRTDGQLGAQQIVGPKAVQTAFYETYGNVCNVGGNLTMDATAGCIGQGDAGGMTITVSNPVLTGLTLEVSAREMIISNGLQMIFISMDIQGNSSGTPAS